MAETHPKSSSQPTLEDAVEPRSRPLQQCSKAKLGEATSFEVEPIVD